MPRIIYNLRKNSKSLDNQSIHVQFSKLLKLIPYNFLKFKFSHFTPHVKLFFSEGNLKFSDSRMRWREKSEKFLPSKIFESRLKFSEK